MRNAVMITVKLKYIRVDRSFIYLLDNRLQQDGFGNPKYFQNLLQISVNFWQSSLL